MHLDQPYLIDGAGRTATTKDIRVHVRNPRTGAVPPAYHRK